MKHTIKNVILSAYAMHILWVMLLASVPPVSRDALTHHLAVPKLWVGQGSIYEIPEILFSYYPQLIDLLYTIPLFFGHDIATKYIHFSFALLTAFIMFLFVRRRISDLWGALSGLMFLTVPIIFKLSITAYVDLGLIFFTTATLFSIAIWFEETDKIKWLLIASICSGLALSCKYNAIVSFLILSLLVPFFFLRSQKNSQHSQQLNAIKFSLLFVTVSLLVFSPWLIRNYNLTGNPIYPLHHKLLVPKGSFFKNPNSLSNYEAVIRQTIEQDLLKKEKSLGPLLTRKLVYDESLPYTLLIPLRIFYEGEDDNPQFFDGRLNILLLLLPVWLLWLVRRKRNFQPKEIVLFMAYSTLLVLLTFFTTDMRSRYISTIIPPLVVLSTYSMYLTNQYLKQVLFSKASARLLTLSLVFLYLIPNFIYSIKLYIKTDPLPYITGKINRSNYIKKHSPEYTSITIANESVLPGKKVLGLYLGNRHYYFTVDVVLLNTLFVKIVENSDSNINIANSLHNLGFSHILVNRILFNNWLHETNKKSQILVTNFFSQNTQHIFTDNAYGLYEIRIHAIPPE